MISYLIAPFSPKKAFEIIENSYEDESYRKNLFVFGFYGFFSFLTKNDFTFNVFNFQFFWELFLNISSSIIAYNLMSLLIYWIGKKLKGKADHTDIISVFAHQLAPSILFLVLVYLLKNKIYLEKEWNTVYLRNFILYVCLFVNFNILLKGIKRFNNFSYLKSVIAIIPFVLMNIIPLAIFFSYYL
ncbi:YIP1 family protein [Wenyingzhuangia sp. IMCC45574]